MQYGQRAERRPRPRKRRPDDGRMTVMEILARNVREVVLALVGCLCAFGPVWFGLAGEGVWPFVAVYGGFLLGGVVMEVVMR